MTFPRALLVYLLLIHTPYLLWFLTGNDWAVGPRAWYVAAGHLGLAAFACTAALRRGTGGLERAGVLLWAGGLALLAGIAVWRADTLWVMFWRPEWLVLTGACAMAGTAALLTGAWVRIERGYWEPGLFVLALWFGVSVWVNVEVRWLEWGRPEYWDQWRRLSATESVVHLGCVGGWLWLIR